MIVYLMRHGIAVDREDPECPPDPKRYLTKKGKEKTRQVAEALRAAGCAPGAFFSSPYVRAEQTAQLVAAVLGFPRDRIRNSEALLPGSRPAELFKLLASERVNEVMCFGHAPHMDEFLAAAIGSRAPFTALKKAGVAALSLEPPAPGKGMLLWLCTPKLLRAAGNEA